MKYYFLIAFILFLSADALAQPAQSDTVFSMATTKDAKAARYRYLVDTSIKQNLLDPLNEENEGEWNDALWAMELLQYKDAFTTQKLGVAWSMAAQQSTYFQKNLLETTFGVYKTEFKTQALQLMRQTKSVAIFIRCAEYVLRADPAQGKTTVISLIKQKFPNDNSIGMQLLKSRIYNSKPQSLPPMHDIFSNNFLPGQTVIYSLQRSSRNYPGLVIIRKPDGTFLKDSSGNYFHTSQLARALTDYPFYITNGNTPQGILRFSGFDVSRLLYIGPTPNLQLQLPFETTVSAFYGDSSYIDSSWSKDLYTSLLPASWKSYNNIYESFYAGKIGRTAIIMHGTTIDPQFYKHQPYYPQTPSLGCLCSFEDWNDDGYRTISNQQKIVNALDSIGSSEGYVVVIDIDNRNSAVDIKEISPLLDVLNYK